MRLQLVATAWAIAAWMSVTSAAAEPATTEPAPPSVTPAAPHPSTVITRVSAESTFYADSDHVTVFSPVATAEVSDVASTWQAQGTYLVDVISAASVDIVSTASQRWQEVRQAATLGAGYQWGDVGARVSAAVSREPDYVSNAAGTALTWRFADKAHLAIIGYSLDHDTIGRTGTSFDVFSQTLWQHDVSGGVTLTLNRSTVLSLLGDFVVESGDQSKPYRYVPMFDATVARTIEKGASIDVVNARREPERPLERLPDHRERAALTARLGYRLAHATLRLEERLYSDTWQLHASTTEIRYIADVSQRLTLWPRLRVHSQSSVYFWRRAYVSSAEGDTLRLPAYRTGDRELGPLVTVTAGMGANWRIGPLASRTTWSVELHGDLLRTQFLDDLYVTSRTGVVAAAGFTGVFE
jgi:hypothetical protein